MTEYTSNSYPLVRRKYSQTSSLYTDPTSSNNMTTIYNYYVSSLLTSPTSGTYAGGDDSYVSYTLSSWGCSLEISTEGSIGLIFSNLAPNNSGYSYSRMYYSTQNEPSYQYIARYETDLYCDSAIYSYDDNNLVIYAKYRPLSSSSISYETVLVISRSQNYEPLTFLFKSNSAQSYSVLIGFKSYNSYGSSWAPTTYTSIFDTNIYSFINSSVVYNIGTNNYSPVVNSNNIAPKLIPPNKNNAVTYSPGYSIDQYTPRFKISLFIEGQAFPQIIFVKDLNTNTITTYNLQDNSSTYIELKKSKYQLYSGNYYRNFDYSSKNMIPGEIVGNVILDSCTGLNISYSSMVIKCLRHSDGFHIGDYQVANDGSYVISNLDSNCMYDMILSDNSKIIEWKVSSYRYPNPYNSITTAIASIISTAIEYKSDHINIACSLDLSGKSYDAIYIYYSDLPLGDFSNAGVSQIDSQIYKIYSGFPIYNYYQFKIVYQGNYVLSDVININKNYNKIAIVGDYSA